MGECPEIGASQERSSIRVRSKPARKTDLFPLALLVAVFVPGSDPLRAQDAPSRAGVLQILENRCLDCHDAETRKGGQLGSSIGVWDASEAQIIVEDWRREYNRYRPHSSPGYRTPAEGV